MTLADNAYTRIRQDIVNGTLLPDHPLRMEALKERYGIGYSPLREALNRLQSERVVVVTPLRGFTVAPVSLDQMWDVIETRIHIETRALSRAIDYGDDSWEADVVSTLHALSLQSRRLRNMDKPTYDELQKLEDRHRSFHQVLISACRSEWLLDFAAKLYVGSERYRYAALSGTADGPDKRDILGEHRALAEASIARDKAQALTLLEKHYQLTGERLEHAMLHPRHNADVPDISV